MIGVVPAAGYATRLGSLDRSKEMLEIDGAPVMEWLVRRMEVGGCIEIRVVTRPEKEDVRQYAATRGLSVVLGRPAHLGASLAAALPSSDETTVAVGFPDSLWEPLDGFARLRERLDDQTDVVLGLFDFPDPTRADVVACDEREVVRDILVKPSEPPTSLIWGCLVAHVKALRGIGRTEWPSDHLRPLIAIGRVRGHFLSDRYLDIGTPESLKHARDASWR